MKVDLRKSLFILPNLFTLSSVLCGFYAILTATQPEVDADDFYRASLLVIFAMFFDTIDGRVARLTKTQSAIGVQLDSLADVVSFGVTPAVLVYRWSLESFGTLGIAACFAYLACGTIRLARFNVITTGESGAPKKPGKYILGLPIPAAAGILISLVVANTAARQTRFSQREELLRGGLDRARRRGRAFLLHGQHDPLPLVQRSEAQRAHRGLRGLRDRLYGARGVALPHLVRARMAPGELHRHRARGAGDRHDPGRAPSSP